MPAEALLVLLSLMQYISVSFQKGRVTCDESYAIIYTVHLRLIYEAKIQLLLVFSWKPAQPRYVKRKKMFFSKSLYRIGRAPQEVKFLKLWRKI